MSQTEGKLCADVQFVNVVSLEWQTSQQLPVNRAFSGNVVELSAVWAWNACILPGADFAVRVICHSRSNLSH